MAAAAAAEAAVAGVAGSAAGLSRRSSHASLLNNKTEDGFFRRIKDVVNERKNLRSVFSSFTHCFDLNESNHVYVNRLTATQSDLESVQPADSATVGTTRELLQDHFAVTVNLENSHLAKYKSMHCRLREEAELRVDRSNSLVLGFKKNDLSYVRVENEGNFTPAEELVNFLHSQKKTEIKLTGVLSDDFVDLVKARGKTLSIFVIDERANKPQPGPAVIEGESCSDEVSPVAPSGPPSMRT